MMKHEMYAYDFNKQNKSLFAERRDTQSPAADSWRDIIYARFGVALVCDPRQCQRQGFAHPVLS
jgi:hypothetical protein